MQPPPSSAPLPPPLCTVGIGLALGRWDVAGGALLLFITNAVTIAASAILLFFVMGFTPPGRNAEGGLPRSLLVSLGLTALLLVLYGYEIVDGWVWIEVQDAEGRVGWIPQYNANPVTATAANGP